jgi:hypothetical protein
MTGFLFHALSYFVCPVLLRQPVVGTPYRAALLFSVSNKKYMYCRDVRQYTSLDFKYEDVKTTKIVKWKDLKEFEKYDCILTSEEKELISQIKTIFTQTAEADRMKAIRNLNKVSKREIRYDEKKCVEFSLEGPERPKITPLNKEIRDIRNLLLYDVTRDIVHGFALPSNEEKEKFEGVITSFKQSSLGKSCCFKHPMLVMCTCCYMCTSCYIYSYFYQPEVARIRSSIPSELDLEILEECISGEVYVKLYTYDYTRYGAHNSGVGVSDVTLKKGAKTNNSHSIAPYCKSN